MNGQRRIVPFRGSLQVLRNMWLLQDNGHVRFSKPVRLECVFRTLFVCVTCLFLFTGCLLFRNREDNLTKNPKFWGGYNPSATYTLNKPLLYDGHTLAEYFYRPVYGGGQLVTWDEYSRESSQYPYVTVIPEGTALRLDLIEFWQSIESHDLHFYGRFVDGPRKGEVMRLLDVSLSYPEAKGEQRKEVEYRGCRVWPQWPNPKFLTEHK